MSHVVDTKNTHVKSNWIRPLLLLHVHESVHGVGTSETNCLYRCNIIEHVSGVAKV